MRAYSNDIRVEIAIADYFRELEYQYVHALATGSCGDAPGLGCWKSTVPRRSATHKPVGGAAKAPAAGTTVREVF